MRKRGGGTSEVEAYFITLFILVWATSCGAEGSLLVGIRELYVVVLGLRLGQLHAKQVPCLIYYLSSPGIF